jgi:hypothetical protein
MPTGGFRLAMSTPNGYRQPPTTIASCRRQTVWVDDAVSVIDGRHGDRPLRGATNGT